MEKNRTKLKAFLSRFIRNCELDDDQDIFEAGLVNSLFAMQLVMFLEKEFNITISNDDIDINNFRSVNAILSLVEGLLK